MTLKENIQAYVNRLRMEENEHNRRMNLVEEKLPLVVLLLEEDEITDPEQVRYWFEGTSSWVYYRDGENPIEYEFLNGFADLAYKSSSGRSYSKSAIVVEGVASDNKEAGALLAKTTMKFSDIFYIEKIEQIYTGAKLDYIVEELLSAEILSKQLIDKVWEGYELMREELIDMNLTPAMVSEFTDKFRFSSDGENILINAALCELNKLRL